MSRTHQHASSKQALSLRERNDATFANFIHNIDNLRFAPTPTFLELPSQTERVTLNLAQREEPDARLWRTALYEARTDDASGAENRIALLQAQTVQLNGCRWNRAIASLR